MTDLCFKTDLAIRIIKKRREELLAENIIILDGEKIMKYIILGNGIPGFTTAKTLREQSLDSKIILISEEPYLSYSHPIITRAPLRGFDVNNFLIED